MATNVLLLRAAGSPLDKYETVCRDHGYLPISVPVLATTLVNLPDLSKIVKEGPWERQLSGVIITSARAVDAWKAVVEQLVRECDDMSTESGWSSIPFYVVGDATATALADIQNITSSQHFTPRDIRGGAESGTSEKLAHYILEDVGHIGGKTLLYLTGDKNRDTLPTIMKDGGIEMLTLQVYQTVGSPHFEIDLLAALSASSEAAWWVVYFAPSAAEFVTPILRKHLPLPTANDHDGLDPCDVRIAAIGPTTATFLHDTLGLSVQVLSPRPMPEALVTAMETFDTSPTAAFKG